jgi:hypothetical protein
MLFRSWFVICRARPGREGGRKEGIDGVREGGKEDLRWGRRVFLPSFSLPPSLPPSLSEALASLPTVAPPPSLSPFQGHQNLLARPRVRQSVLPSHHLRLGTQRTDVGSGGCHHGGSRQAIWSRANSGMGRLPYEQTAPGRRWEWG